MTQTISKIRQKGFYLRTFILELFSKTFKFRTQIEIGPYWKVNIDTTGF